LRDKIVVYGAVPRANIRPTDLGPVIIPEGEPRPACMERRALPTFRPRLRTARGLTQIVRRPLENPRAGFGVAASRQSAAI